MREIKFRAWYKPQKEMVESKRLESINFEVKTIGAYIVKDGKGFNKLRISDFELMQYTGLRDKNENEVYEGDIVECTSELLTNFGKTKTGIMSTTLYQVIWHNEGWGKKVIKSQQLVLGFESNGLDISLKYSSVIGNIYANTDLLELALAPPSDSITLTK